MADIRVKVTTKTQRFSENTVDTDFTYTLQSTTAANDINVQETDSAAEHVFKAVPAGSYKVSAEKMGFKAEAFVTVEAGGDPGPVIGVDLQVPESVEAVVETTAAAKSTVAAKK